MEISRKEAEIFLGLLKWDLDLATKDFDSLSKWCQEAMEPLIKDHKALIAKLEKDLKKDR